MTREFGLGLVEGFSNILYIIRIQLADPKGTSETRQTLETLAAAIEISKEEAERATPTLDA